jgi:mutator protein MutT
MANQELYDKTYSVPPQVLKYIQTTLVSNPNGEGVKRAKFILKNGVLTYQDMKRLKNFFDTFNPETDNKIQYALAGGFDSPDVEDMKRFIERTLATDRDAVKRSKEVKRDMTSDPNSELKPYQTPRLNEENREELKKNAIAVIVNDDNKILLLKRAESSEWGSNQYGLVGGRIEKNETPKQAVKREIQEETGLDIKKFINSFTIQRHKSSIEHVFVCRFKGDPTDITLNSEHTNYGWFSVQEMKFLDTVPHLIEYITLAFKKYE